MTFSIVARCETTGMLGMAISSSSPAVAARCVHIRAGIGAVASQNVTDPQLGGITLDYLTKGLGATVALQRVSDNRAHINYRQLLAVDAHGQSAVFSGNESLGTVAQANTHNVAAAGNLLQNTNVPQTMMSCFLDTKGHLAQRLFNALQAGLSAGGEAGAVHSAGLQVKAQYSFPIVDLRCDWTETCPIEQLASAWQVYEPQMDDYVQRAIDPTVAPSYGVPGDQ